MPDTKSAFPQKQILRKRSAFIFMVFERNDMVVDLKEGTILIRVQILGTLIPRKYPERSLLRN